MDDFSSIIIPLLIICFLIFGHFEEEGDLRSVFSGFARATVVAIGPSSARAAAATFAARMCVLVPLGVAAIASIAPIASGSPTPGRRSERSSIGASHAAKAGDADVVALCKLSANEEVRS